MSEGRLLTVTEAAAEFFISEKTIRRWLERALISWYEPGLLLESDVAQVELLTRRVSRMGQMLAFADALGASSAASTIGYKPCRSETDVPE